MTTYAVSPIGWVQSSRGEPIDDDWESVTSDGTPVLDVKPVMAEFLPPGEIHQPDWSHELMATYWSRS